MENKTLEQAWVIKYKPKTLDELIAPRKVKADWQNKEINVDALFTGPPGTGKSSLASLLCEGHNTKKIDCSTDRGIDTIRTDILTFATTASLKKGTKKLWLEEIDGLTPIAQNALKATMDTIGGHVNIIACSNHPEKLIKRLHSRFERTEFVFEKDELKDVQIQYLNRIKFILQKEGYKMSNDAITYLLENVFPDIRQTLIMLYKVCRSIDKTTIIDVSVIDATVNGNNFELYKALIKPHTEPEMYKFVMGMFQGKATEAFASLGDPFLKWLIAEKHNPEMMLTIGAIVHKYQFESSMTSYNPMLGLLSCCNAINSFFKQV